jgi:hypothetical protein
MHCAWQTAGMIVGVVFTVISTLMAAIMLGGRAPDEPVTRMVTFAAHQAARYNQTDHDALQLSRYDTFVDSACVASSSLEGAREALTKQLVSLPPDVRVEIVGMALTEGASVETTRQNISNAMSDDALINVFMYYINTVYTPGLYRTCVMASGIKMQIGEVIVDMVEERSEQITGYRPCHCGYLYCEKCPIVSETRTQKPVYARHTGNIQWHVKLQNLLAGMASRQVAGLASSPPPLATAASPDLVAGWSEPHITAKRFES